MFESAAKIRVYFLGRDGHQRCGRAWGCPQQNRARTAVNHLAHERELRSHDILAGHVRRRSNRHIKIVDQVTPLGGMVTFYLIEIEEYQEQDG